MEKHMGGASPTNHLKLLKVIIWRNMWEVLLPKSDSGHPRITPKQALIVVQLCSALCTVVYILLSLLVTFWE